MLKSSLIAKTDAKANDTQIVKADNLRITFLTSRLIRVECGSDFTDLASKTVLYRRFEAGEMTVKNESSCVSVETKDVVFTIKKGVPYSVFFKKENKTEILSKQKNLKGTRRTLDNTFGAVPLDDGLITRGGAYLLDDSKTILLDENGRFVKRTGNTKDYYVFAYGNDYRNAINAFYKISGYAPLIPRYALGVWWSRYHAYTQQEYLDLMDRFKAESIPITVATVDMDWHYVRDIKQKFGVDYGGWTGYSWDKELFPDYKAFLKKLKDDNHHVTLNLHPADGVHCYEDMYSDMAKAVGIDSNSKERVPFKCGSDEHWNAYFDVLHKPYEKEGVDFWWIDWQQGKKSDVDGLDPLEALNHYHFLDNAEDGRMPLILSRYAGLGSHRYPLGFSGDTAISWKVLDFQPYFTINAANAAYTWWSHDIGGHFFGYRDDDLYLRWIQFGVFSPIMRLHSTAKDFLGKEPWKYRADVRYYATQWLRFRHRLIPYIFTMNYRTHEDGIALCEPMYYSYPDREEAYSVPNQYMFGSELMIAPITTPQIKELQSGAVKAWLPEGRWTDVATNQSYKSESYVTLFRDINSIPILAREGAIIPLADCVDNRVDNPENLTILAYSGNGSFDLIEDNSRTDYAEHKAVTRLEMTYENEALTFKVNAVEGDRDVVPNKRNYRILVKDLTVDAKPLEIIFDNASTSKSHSFTVENAKRITKETIQDFIINVFSRWQETTNKKDLYYKDFMNITDEGQLRVALNSTKLPKQIRLALEEYLKRV